MPQHVIAFHYQLTNAKGDALDASTDGNPLIFMTGVGQIIPGLEKELEVMAVGSKKTLTVLAKEAYGEYNAQLIYKVKTSQLPKQDVKVGDMFEVGQQEQYFPVTVTAIEGEDITLDGNHPLAGQDLTFSVEVVQKRPATEQEITHGHVHGAGGCNH